MSYIDPTVSEETVRAPRHVLLEETLAAIIAALRARPPSPFTREIFAEAERYRRAIEGWAQVPPATHQRAAMFDCVIGLRAKVAEGGMLAITPPDAPPSAAPTRSRSRGG